MTELSATDWLVCVAYLAIVFGVALRCAEGQQNNDDYFIGGRQMNWWVVGTSMFATSFSSISFLGLPQQGAYQDFSFYLTLLMIPLVITPILWLVFVPMFVRLQVSSGYEYMGHRFGRPARLIGSLLYCVYAIGWMGTMLYAIALTMQTVMQLSDAEYVLVLVGTGVFATLYTVLGGLRAVVWTDVMQAVILGGAIVLVLILAVNRIEGGWPVFWEIANEHEKFQMFHLNSPLWAAENFSARNSVFTAVAFGMFLYLPGYAVSQNMIQRYVCSGSLQGGRRVVLLSAAINAVLGFLFLYVGVALFAFYSQPGGAGMPMAGVEIGKEDQILPHFVATQFPGVGLVGLILAGLFAAAMSTIDSGINGVSSVIVYDWMQGRRVSLHFSRTLSAGLGAVVILSALVVPVLGDDVIGIITTIAGTSLGMVLAIYLLGMFDSRANLAGANIGLGAGLACLAAVAGLTKIPTWWYGAFTILPTILVGAIASRFFPPPDKRRLDGTLMRK